MFPKNIVVIAGPAGSGKDAIIRELLKQCSNTTKMVTATTRAIRPGEHHGLDYHFMQKEQFEKEIVEGNILEYYHRKDTDTYYGTYKPDIESRIKQGKILLGQVQIVGALFFKENYCATTFFIMPPSLDAFERRVRARSPMSDIEWNERLLVTKREVEEDSKKYDFCISNEDGKLQEAVDNVVAILQKEGYTLSIS